MPKAESEQEQVESTTGGEPTPKSEPSKVVDLSTEKASAPVEEESKGENTSNGVSTSLKRKSTGDTADEKEGTGEKVRRLSVEEVPAEGAADPEDSSDVPQTSEGGDGEFDKVPPWVHSDVAPQAIGWRMGALEQYKFDFWDWFVTLSDEDQQRYKDKYPPPEAWANFYDNESENEDENEECA